MKTFHFNFAYLSLLFVCFTFALTAQNHHNPDGHKWGSQPEDFDPPFSQVELETVGFRASCHISRTKAIYTALQEGDVSAINAQMSTEVNWNGQTGFPSPVGDPHFNPNGIAEVLFDKTNSNWTNWKVYELTYEETANSIVTVKGYYKATQRGVAIDVPFIHVWTWKNSYVSKFQHFESSEVIAERY